MNNSISVNIEDFVPGRNDLPILNLDSATSVAVNALEAKIYSSVRELSATYVFGTRQNYLENEVKELIINFLDAEDALLPDNIVFGFGSYSILERIAWKMLQGTLLGHLPQFRYFPLEYMQRGGDYLGVWNENLSLPAERLIKALESPRIGTVYINNPVNPTGQLWDRGWLLGLIELCMRKNVLVIVDEVYGDLLDADSSMARYVTRYPNLIVVRSLSKIFGLQNVRVGYMIAGPALRDRYLAVRNWNEATNVGMISAREILSNTSYRNALRQECMQLKPLLLNVLRQKGFKSIEGDASVPLVYTNRSDIQDAGEYFRRQNIKVEGSGAFQVFDASFPAAYARIRVPVVEADITALQQRL